MRTKGVSLKMVTEYCHTIACKVISKKNKFLFYYFARLKNMNFTK